MTCSSIKKRQEVKWKRIWEKSGKNHQTKGGRKGGIRGRRTGKGGKKNEEGGSKDKNPLRGNLQSEPSVLEKTSGGEKTRLREGRNSGGNKKKKERQEKEFRTKLRRIGPMKDKDGGGNFLETLGEKVSN